MAGLRTKRMKMLDVPQSGSIAGVTSSRNRFGQYKRSRAVPVNPNSSQQGVVRARLSNNSAAWRALTDVQRAGWTDLGSAIARTDKLGQAYTLTGFQAYCMVNNNKLAAGDATVSAAPLIVTPGALATVVITLTSAVLSVAYTVTPLAANTRLFSYVSLMRSAGRAFEGDFRLLAVSAAAAASPANLFAAYQARFGTPVTGTRIFFAFRLYNAGFIGGPLITSQVVA